ncbi:hypothetical protein FHY15_000245 [Xanthomonas arboricola]|uniref:hypothetical protein n=1 Tax=Xanthomonas arboricola TaxID=56448 RepID=UPI00141A7709|nr:hypothetical protein [Xanthomonas arboricola]NIK31149.1 hypothetical protein [Xanthomonas arboricola]
MNELLEGELLALKNYAAFTCRTDANQIISCTVSEAGKGESRALSASRSSNANEIVCCAVRCGKREASAGSRNADQVICRTVLEAHW